MTPLLQRAIANLATLSSAHQDCIASLIFEELASEQRWVESFDKSPGQLEQMAIIAMREYNQLVKKSIKNNE